MFKATELDKSTRTGQGPFWEVRGVCAKCLWGPPGFKGLERGGGIRIPSRKEQQEGRREVSAKWYSGGQVKKSLSRRKESTAPNAVDRKEHVVVMTKIALKQQYCVLI